MAAERKIIDIDDNPELSRIVDDVQVNQMEAVLRRNGKDLAIVTPIESNNEELGRGFDPERLKQALRDTARAWRGLIDGDKLIEDIYADRERPSRPLPKLLNYLVDTDWIIDHLAGRQDAVALLASISSQGFAISMVTYAEVFEGIYGGSDPIGAEVAFDRLLEEVPVLTMTHDIARQSGKTLSTLRSSGRPLPLSDVFIAMTAISHDLTLISRNVRHFNRIPNLKIYDYLASEI